MMFRAEEWGLRARDSNPCLGIAKNPRNHVARLSLLFIASALPTTARFSGTDIKVI